jgi:hypothetical protein
VVLYGPQWHVDFLVSLAIDRWPSWWPVHRQSVLFVLVGAQNHFICCWESSGLCLSAHYQVKELGKSYTCPAKTVMQRVSKNAMRIECQEDATYIR